MKIDIKSLFPESKPEPSDEQVAPYTAKAKSLFAKCGMRETQLVKKVAPIAGRILFDIGDSSTACWRDGKPVLADTGFKQADKGVLLAGGVGIGKTTIMRAMAAMLDAEYITVPDLAGRFSTAGEDGFWAMAGRSEKWDLFLDDLGAEDKVKSYSNAFPIKDLIYKRYDLWQRFRIRTHIATNLSGEQVEERYDKRVRDRFKEMMIPVIGKGESLR